MSKAKACEYCGQEFVPKKHVGKRQRFCSEECQRAWWIENRQEAGKVYTYVCQNCGKEYETIYSNRDTCCSRECAWEYASKRALVEKECICCGRLFEAARSASDYCSDECHDIGYRHVCRECGAEFYTARHTLYCSEECRSESTLRQGRLWHRHRQEALGRNAGRTETLTCQECGEEFVREIYNQIPMFCSKKCARGNWERLHPAKARVMRARQRHVRRARKYGNGPVESIDPISVFERDGWTCGICEHKVDAALVFPHPRSASLDHIVPLAEGGTHTWSNVQLAHLACNSEKGAAGGGQMRLGLRRSG